MAQAVFLEQYGGPEELLLKPATLRAPGRGEIHLRQTAIGVNFHDIYVRSGLYQTLALPGTPGIEAVGIVEAVGEDVGDIRVGDRVGYIESNYGAYASERLLDARKAIALPPGIADAPMAATLMKAFTAAVLVQLAHHIVPGQTVLIHAAAGGMGRLLCNWASRLGATVIGTVSSAEKAVTAKAAGANHIIFYREEDFVARVRDITAGRGVDACYDSVGKDTFLGSLDCLAFLGVLVNFGQASGAVEPFAPSRLAARSLTVCRPILFHYLQDPVLHERLTGEVFAALASGIIEPIEPISFALKDAPEAHRLLESGRSPGGVVLIP